MTLRSVRRQPRSKRKPGPRPPRQRQSEPRQDEHLKFDLSYMDSPYFDNVWMEHPGGGGHFRLALLLKDIDKIGGEYFVKIEALHFPDHWFSPAELPPALDLVKGR